jgi:hypothetical protein
MQTPSLISKSLLIQLDQLKTIPLRNKLNLLFHRSELEDQEAPIQDRKNRGRVTIGVASRKQIEALEDNI